MPKFEFLTDPKHIGAWLKSMDVKDWTLSKDGQVDVNGNVHLDRKLGDLAQLPVRFGKVSGEFWCSDNKLISLKGALNT